MRELTTLQFENSRCRNVCIDGVRWWVGNDVCAILGYTNPKVLSAAY